MGASTGVTLGYDTIVRAGVGSPAVWVEWIGFDDVNFPDQTPDDVDVTHLRSPGGTEESIPGLKKVANFVLPLQYVPGSATDVSIAALEATGEDFIFEITPSGGGAHQWVAYVANYRMSSAPAKDKKMAEVSLRVKAKIASGVIAAPVNTTLPAISGTAKVGQILTAWPGVFAPTGEITYQWQEETGGTWANIAGATTQIFTAATAQLGKRLRVIATAENAGGATSATSAATIAVVA